MNSQGDGILAVVAADARRFLKGCGDICHISQVDDIAGGEGDGNILQTFHVIELYAGADRQLLVADLHRTRRIGQVRRAHGRRKGIETQVVLRQLLRHDLHLDILFLSAADVDAGDGTQLFQLGHYIVVYIVIQICRRIIVDGDGHGRHGVDIELHDRRGIHVIGQTRLHRIHGLL